MSPEALAHPKGPNFNWILQSLKVLGVIQMHNPINKGSYSFFKGALPIFLQRALAVLLKFERDWSGHKREQYPALQRHVC